ncbi:MAG: PstA family ABC transporter permease [Cellulosilyticaceae bacterium]
MKIKHYLLKVWMISSGILTFVLIAGIFFYICLRGLPLITPTFLFDRPKGMPLGSEGGIFPAIIGSLLLGLLCGLIGGILSLCSALFMVFYCKSSWLHTLLLYGLQALSGIPSIILGLFGYSFLMMELGMKRSLLCSSITLSFMVIPFITLRFVKALEELPQETLLTSFALGLPKGYTLWHYVLPATFGRLLTALGLGIGFAMGATAPILFTGAVMMAPVPTSIMDPFMALPYHLYVLANEGISLDMAYGSAFVLMFILFILNFSCRYFYNRKGKNTP